MKKVFLATVAFLFLPIIALAQDPAVINLRYSQHTDAVEFLLSLTNWLYTFSLVAVVIAILIGAYMFVAGGGNPERLKTGRKVITWAVIGLAIIMTSKGIIALVNALLKP